MSSSNQLEMKSLWNTPCRISRLWITINYGWFSKSTKICVQVACFEMGFYLKQVPRRKHGGSSKVGSGAIFFGKSGALDRIEFHVV